MVYEMPAGAILSRRYQESQYPGPLTRRQRLFRVMALSGSGEVADIHFMQLADEKQYCENLRNP
jgi:hypothetical protein